MRNITSDLSHLLVHGHEEKSENIIIRGAKVAYQPILITQGSSHII